MRVGLYDDPIFREHDPGQGHPERAERLEALRRGLKAAGHEPRLRLLPPRPATAKDLLRVHTEDHLALIASTKGKRLRLDPDTEAGPRSYEAALLAAGAVLDAVDQVMDGELDRAFCAVRPPGHHAEAGRAMGFCLFNNVAVGAAHALARGLQRVAVVDFDVHHGNGTQAIFERDPRVLYVSTHAYPFYPGTGALDEVGEGPGHGFTVNLPLPEPIGDAEYARIYREVVLPVCRAFDPELVLVSAGFDPFDGDPLAGMRVSPAGFAALARACLDAAGGAAAGRVVFALEGGYHLDGIARSAAAVMAQLLELEPAPRLPEGRGGGLDPLLDAYREQLAPHWPILRA